MEGTRDVQCSDVTDVNLRSSDGTRMLAYNAICCRCLARARDLRCWINFLMFFSSVVMCRD